MVTAAEEKPPQDVVRLPEIPLDQVQAEQDRATQLERRALRPATRAAYRADFQRWAAWCAPRGLEPFPPRWPDVHTYLGTRAQEPGARISSLRRVVTALSVTAQEGGFWDKAGTFTPLGDPLPRADARPTEQTAKVLKNIAAELKGNKEERAAPMMARHLVTMCQVLETSTSDVRDRVLLTMMWFGMLRSAEASTVAWEDLRWKDNSVVVDLRGKGKTESEQPWVELPTGLTTGTDPIAALQTWRAVLDRVGLPATGPVLRQVTKGEVIGGPMSRFAVVERIQLVAKKAGLEHLHFTGHSPRRGAVTQATADGRPPVLIRRQSRHASADMLEKYVDSAALPNAIPTAGLA